MTTRLSPADPGMGVSFMLSAVIHLTVFLLLAWYGSRHQNLRVAETYYVDVVNLPVAAPRSGDPGRTGDDQAGAPPAAKAAEAPMPLPAKAAPAKTAKPSKPSPGSPDPAGESSAEFAERMAKLERAAEARHEEATLARLRDRVKGQGSGRAGMPGGSGKEAGSDYLAYVQSRLKDAFQKTISHTSSNPEMTVRIFIDGDGKLSRKKAERSSGDRAFEISVLRAIDLASEHFPPPPGRKVFEGVFVFRREGIAPNKP
jgi:colicin import membrane protein